MPSSKFCGVVAHVSAYVYCKLGLCLKQTLKKLYFLLDCRCPISFAVYVSGYTLYAIQDLEKTTRNCRQHGYCRPRFVISNPTTFIKQAIVDCIRGTQVWTTGICRRQIPWISGRPRRLSRSA